MDNLHFIVQFERNSPHVSWLACMTMTPFIGICFLTGLLGPHPAQNSDMEVVNPCSRAPHTIAAYSHLSLDDFPQSFVQFGKIKTMVYAGEDDGA